MGEATKYEKSNHLAILTMNRPDAMNAMNAVMRKEMGEAFVDFKDDNDSWVLLITGAGDRAFSAGMDLKEMAANLAGGAGRGVTTDNPDLARGNIEIWKPVIAAINGVAVGGGLELALACDVRILSDNARLGLSEAKRGIVPGGRGTIRLPRMVPFGIAAEMLFSGDMISAQEAYRIGLANQVVPQAELMSAATKMAERFIESAPLAVQSIKETLYRTNGMPLKEALNASFGGNVFASEDAKEGTAAFGQKRKPQWKGR
jgi:enoyl-CoA hydratase/carnithine racemase